MREVVLEYMKELFSEQTATNIEKSIYNSSIDTSDKHKVTPHWEHYIYKHIYIEIFLRVKRYLETTDLKDKILKKEISSKEIGYLTGKHFQPEQWNLEHLLKQDEVTEDGVFTCTKCGSKKTTYYSLQTRSADEPMTNFITCCNCKNRWKM